jgi:hypothetical protein
LPAGRAQAVRLITPAYAQQRRPCLTRRPEISKALLIGPGALRCVHSRIQLCAFAQNNFFGENAFGFFLKSRMVGQSFCG